MKKWLMSLGLMAVLVQPVLAFRPAGWVYFNYPWAYDNNTRDWYWFNTSDTQWIANMGSGQWAKLQNSALASGWVYFTGNFAFAQGNGAWHYINEADTQWVVNMRTGIWSRFGETTAPDGMVLIPGGTNAGTNPLGSEESYDRTYPEIYSLTVESFYMDATHVTKAQWDEVYTWAVTNGYSIDRVGSGKAPNHPVQTVTWYDAVKWCNARSEREGRPAVYTVNGRVYRYDWYDDVVQTSAAGYRLPTSTEWEYAARGGLSGRRFPWGDTISHSDANYLSSILFSYDISPTRNYHPTYYHGVSPYTSPVGSFAANGYGLYDMAGNVKEWIFNRPSSGEGSGRVLRGGRYSHNASLCRVGYRSSLGPGSAVTYIGFRTVLPTSSEEHELTVFSGSGGGAYADGTAVAVTAHAPPPGHVFAVWLVEPAVADLGGDFSVFTASTVVTMPAQTVTLRAIYQPVSTVPAGMVLIPGGTNSGTDPDFGLGLEEYSLTVRSFYMDKYEVTKALWDEVHAWAVANGYNFDNAGLGKAANHPVHTVNGYDVVKWCNARSEMEGRLAVYTVNGVVYKAGKADNVVQVSAAGYRLPTYVEWEYAARGGLIGMRFPWGDTITHSQANYYSSSSYSYDVSSTRGYHPTYNDGVDPYTSPVGFFAANRYGLYDMTGNVNEMCWHLEYGSARRAIRGGSWNNYANSCRVGGYSSSYPDYARNDIGFRAALTPSQQ